MLNVASFAQAVGKYNPLTEKLIVFANQTDMRVVHGVNYLFTATGQATYDQNNTRLLQTGWLWSGSWTGVNNTGCNPAGCGTMGTGFSLVRDVRWDRAANKLTAPPVPEYSKLRAALLVNESEKQLKHSDLWTLPIKGTAGSTVEIQLNVRMPSPGATAAVAVAVLAPPTAAAGAMQLVLNVSGTPVANGTRIGTLSVTNRFAPPWRNMTTISAAPFVVLPHEQHVNLLIYVDRYEFSLRSQERSTRRQYLYTWGHILMR